MMIERTIPSESVVDCEQLMTELIAAAATVGAVCFGVGVSPPDPPNDDTLYLHFDAAPIDAEVDVVIAAHEDGVGDFAWPESISTTQGAWHDVVNFPILPGSHVEIDIRAKLRIGTASDFSVSRIYFDNIASRRGNGPVQIADAVGLVRPYGDIPQASFRLRPNGNNNALLQLRVQRTATVVLEDLHVEIESKEVPA